MKTLVTKLKALATIGHRPGIYLRGRSEDRTEFTWRAHIDVGDTYWADAATPLKALNEALTLYNEHLAEELK